MIVLVKLCDPFTTYVLSALNISHKMCSMVCSASFCSSCIIHLSGFKCSIYPHPQELLHRHWGNPRISPGDANLVGLHLLILMQMKSYQSSVWKEYMLNKRKSMKSEKKNDTDNFLFWDFNTKILFRYPYKADERLGSWFFPFPTNSPGVIRRDK